jgi:uncharacterized lipoprotein YddW (UPF0748 family)
MRGVWLTNTDSDVLHTRENLQHGLEQLAARGFDTVYPSMWHRGHTLYPSAIGKKYTGHWTLPHPSYANRDCLAELIEIAHSLGIKVVAWWEYGLMLPPDSALAQRYPGALTFTNTGTTQRRKATSAQLDPCVWLNPCDPFVVEMMSELLVDLVERYPLDGIQFDDHWAWPVELGFDPATQAYYRQSQSGIWPMRRRHSWADWSTQQVTNCFRQVVGDMKAIRNDLWISIAPNPLRFSINNYRMNWQQWLDLVDELVLQVYRYDLPGFKAEITKPEIQEIKHKTSIGILTGLKGKVQSAELIQQQIMELEASGFQGFACFFYETVIDPTLISVLPRKPL